MYNGNYPNDYEENQGQAQNSAQQGENFNGTDVTGAQQGSSYGTSQDQERQDAQNASYAQQGTSDIPYERDAQGAQNRQDAQNNYQYHNYYSDRYRGTQNGYQNQGGSDGYQTQGRSGSYQNQSGSNGYQNRDGGYQGTNGAYQNNDGGYSQRNGGYQNYGGGFNGGSDGRDDRGRRMHTKKTSKGKAAIAVALVVVFVAFCAGISWMAVSTLQEQIASATADTTEPETIPEKEPETVPVQQEPEQKIPEEDQIASAGSSQVTGNVTAVVTDVTEVVERVMPASVSITNNYTQQVQDFWGQTYSQDEEASGSGIIIGQNDTELLIVTNNHVVDGAEELHVQFIDGEVVEAQVKGVDSAVDLAVIAVELDSIEPETKSAICIAEMGDSDSLKIGEPAIAIGNALGYGQSVTTGVISALNRSPEVSETGTSNALIQTDAAINPGNSGGALLNIKGQVIGINSSKIGGTAVEGMGYAVPISTAKPIIEELMTHETKARVADEDRGYLGISCINVTSDLSENFNMPEGIFVAQVYEGTGADRAGLVRGDIITEFDGTAVKSQEDLTRLMGYYKAGTTVEITIMQGSPTGYQAKSVQITLSSYDEMNESTQKSQEEAQEEQGRQIRP